MKEINHSGLRTWVEIDKSAIAYNYKQFRNLIALKTKLMGVVKSNAYGHNFLEFAKELVTLGVDYLGVDSVVEGLALRREGIKTPILVLGYTLPEMQKGAVENDLDLSISNFEALDSLLKQTYTKIPKIHLKVDTGMTRQGFQLSDLEKVIELLQKNKDKFSLDGLFTHFAAAKNPSFPNDTKKQIEQFEVWRSAILEAGFTPICHASATSGTILFRQAEFDMVRVGMGMYGLWPSIETKAYAEQKMPLKPVLSWRTIVGEVKTLTENRGVGYDLTENLPAGAKVAILPVGYWHGYPRSLSSLGPVLINGQKTRIIGRVSMDMLIVDVTNISNIKVGDVATLIGSDGNEIVSAEELSYILDISWYELVTRINPLIKRLYF